MNEIGGGRGNSMEVTPPYPDGSFLFIWASERTGFMHLYLYRYVPGEDRAQEVRQITSGQWVVESVVGVDQVRKRRFSSAGSGPGPGSQDERRA